MEIRAQATAVGDGNIRCIHFRVTLSKGDTRCEESIRNQVSKTAFAATNDGIAQVPIDFGVAHNFCLGDDGLNFRNNVLVEEIIHWSLVRKVNSVGI